MKKTIMVIFLVMFFQSIGITRSLPEFPVDYSRLLEFIKMQDKEEPFYIFNDFEDDFDADSYKTTMEYFNSHPAIGEKLRSDLNGKEVRWELLNIEHRILFVPETREEYSRLYKSYCNQVIKYILDKTNFNNPYSGMHTLVEAQPELFNNKGITAFLVHNLVKEFNSTFVFFNEKNKKIKVKLNGRIFLGEVGSYTSFVILQDNGDFELKRNNFTVWQNSAANPYTALMTPVEETLHILLRENTEKMIKEKIDHNSVKTIENIQTIADEWISVEEAVVGGLVHALFPGFAKQYLGTLQKSLEDEDLETKSKFCKYKYLKRGIDLVERLGYKEAIRMYKENTKEFKKLLKSQFKEFVILDSHDELDEKKNNLRGRPDVTDIAG